MPTRLKMDLAIGFIEAEGDDAFVKSVYEDFKQRLDKFTASAHESYRRISSLLDDARICLLWQEYSRANRIYTQALEKCPRNTDNGILAEILEGLDQTRMAIESGNREVPMLQASVDAEPDNPEIRFRLALTLSRVGRDDEALTEYEAALSNPDGLCADCFRNLWNNIGWYYYRQANFHEALRWFEQTYAVANNDEAVGKGSCNLALENKILCFTALGMAREAEVTAREYIDRYGRLPFPERRALEKLGVDADTIYVERRHGPAM